jgi:hypothetical protein
MSIIVNNTDGQLNIDNNGILDVYAVRSIKSVSRGVDASGNYYIAINFIANDKNNSLRIYLKDVSSPVAWTNDLTGANAALADIRDWLGEIIDVQITEANDSIQIYASNGTNNVPVLVGQQDCGDSLAVTLCTKQAEVQMKAMLIEGNGIVTDNLSTYLPGGASVYSISFASRGTSYVNISVDGGGTFARLNQGETLSLDANGIMNYYSVNEFYWNSISASASLLIAVNYI